MTNTFSEAGTHWLTRVLPFDIRENDRPLSANSQSTYRCAFNRVASVLGDRPVSAFTLEVLRDYVAKRRSDKSKPATICQDLAVIKLIVEQQTVNGVPLYPLRMDRRFRKFVRVPEIDPEEQVAPLAPREHIETALRDPEIAGPVAIAAGLGLRVSEILNLYIGDLSQRDCWDRRGIVHVRLTLKTKAAKRSIPVPAELNKFLIELAANKAEGDRSFDVSRTRLYERLRELGLSPMHAYRRFFVTEREKAQVPMNPSVLTYVVGHAKGKRNVTARYNFAAKDFELIRREMERCPVGFSLPTAATPQLELVTA